MQALTRGRLVATALFVTALLTLFFFDNVRPSQGSVEVGVATVSPIGPSGGYAIPASCPSYEHTPGQCDPLPPPPTPAPSVITDPATNITTDSAIINARANPNGGDTLGWFRYGTSSAACAATPIDSTRIPAGSGNGYSLGSGSSLVPYSANLSGLQPNTLYYFCAIASNGVAGTSINFGSVLTFTTDALPAPGGRIDATPAGVNVGETSAVDWDSNNVIAGSCTVNTGNAEGVWIGDSDTQTTNSFATVGSYTYSLICDGTDGSTNVLIDSVTVSVTDPTYPNLVSGPITYTGTLQDGETVNFNSSAENVGGTDSGDFHNHFTYQYGGTSGSWSDFPLAPGHISQSNLAPTASRADGPVPLVVTDTPNNQLYVQHCVDSLLEVDESAAGENPNCEIIGPLTISSAPSSPTIVECSATPDSGIVEGDPVSWAVNVTGGTPPYSYAWTFPGKSPANTNPAVKTYNSPGNKTAQVVVTDSNSLSTGPFDCAPITVSDAPVIIDFKVCADSATDISDATCEDVKSVQDGTPVKLLWESPNADSCDPVAPPNFVTGGSPSGSYDLVATVGTDVYTIRCTNGAEADIDTATISAGAGPTITADPGRARLNEPFDIDWDTGGSNGDTCTIIGGSPSGDLPTAAAPESGTAEDTIAGETTYVIDCPFGSDSVTVELIPGVFET